MAGSDVASEAVLGCRVATVSVTESGSGQKLADSKDMDQKVSPLASDGEGPAEEMHPRCLSWRLAGGQWGEEFLVHI